MIGDLLSKLDQRFLIADGLPASVLVGATLVLYRQGSFGPDRFGPLESAELPWRVAAIVALTLLAAFGLATAQRAIVMLYEGYPFKGFAIARKRELARHKELIGKITLLRQRYGAARDENDKKKIQAETVSLQYRRNNLFPADGALVLPTRLGNAIRAFERYADERYGIESIVMWPRLVAVLPEDLRERLDQSETSLQFALKTTLVLQLLAAELIFGAAHECSGGLLGASIALLAFSYGAYRVAVSAAVDRGYLFNAAFDLYRRDLLRRLGLRPPDSLADERLLWGKLWYLIYWGVDDGLKFDDQIDCRVEQGSKAEGAATKVAAPNRPQP